MTHDDVTKISNFYARGPYDCYLCAKFHYIWKLFNGKSGPQKNRVQNLWDFSDKKKKEKEKKKNQNKNNSFSALRRKSQKKKSEQEQ